LSASARSAINSNYPEFPDSCFTGQFAIVIDVYQMLIDRPHVLVKQLGDQRLRQPDRLVFETALDARASILRLVEDYRGLRLLVVRHGFSLQFSIEYLVQKRVLQFDVLKDILEHYFLLCNGPSEGTLQYAICRPNRVGSTDIQYTGWQYHRQVNIQEFIQTG
jgi:hypothetical protein